jgi:hypothetical protein
MATLASRESNSRGQMQVDEAGRTVKRDELEGHVAGLSPSPLNGCPSDYS